MIKKVKSEQLTPGMYIHDVNCGWLDHPFLTNSVKIKNEDIIREIVEFGIRDVYIDTEKGIDVSDAPTIQEVNQQIEEGLERIATPETEAALRRDEQVPVRQELMCAREVKREATNIVHRIMEDIRLGKQIKIEQVNHTVENMIESIMRNRDALMSLSRIKKVDTYTFFHSVSVGVLMIAFGNEIGLERPLIKSVGIGGLLHDIGKVRVPAAIISKPGKLTDQEFKIARQHVEYGCEILTGISGIDRESFLTARQHHERIDGTGYPDMLSGEDISLCGQMAAIVDVYDALTSSRSYKRQLHPTAVLRKLYEWSEFYFNRTLVEQFIRCIGIYPVGTLVALRSGWIGVVVMVRNGEKSLLKPVVRLLYNKKTESYRRIPVDIDLSESPDNGEEDNIEGYELAEKWNIQPEMYL